MSNSIYTAKFVHTAQAPNPIRKPYFLFSSSHTKNKNEAEHMNLVKLSWHNYKRAMEKAMNRIKCEQKRTKFTNHETKTYSWRKQLTVPDEPVETDNPDFIQSFTLNEMKPAILTT